MTANANATTTAALAAANTAHTQLKADFFGKSPNLDRCASLLNQAKLALAHAGILIVVNPAHLPDRQLDVLLARDILEIGALHSIRSRDIPAFERYFSQLQPYYIDYAAHLPDSPRHLMLCGLHLLSLLAQNRIAEFHCALELIPPNVHHSNIYIKHPVHLEQALMEGAYNKVWHARGDVPADECLFFIDLLMATIRNEIASCAERSYDTLPLPDVAVLLLFPAGPTQAADVREFCIARGWTIDSAAGLVRFVTDSSLDTELHADLILRDVLGYARELERIV